MNTKEEKTMETAIETLQDRIIYYKGMIVLTKEAKLTTSASLVSIKIFQEKIDNLQKAIEILKNI